MGRVRNKKTMAGKWSPTGKPLPTAGRRGPLPNAHVGRHSPTRPGQAGHTMAHSSSRSVSGGLLLPEGSTPTSTGKPIASLALAYQLTQRASKVGFDWPDTRGFRARRGADGIPGGPSPPRSKESARRTGRSPVRSCERSAVPANQS